MSTTSEESGITREDWMHQTSRDRRIVVQEAGLPKLSLPSVVAGTLTAYGAFALVAALVGGLLSAADVDTDFSTNDWASTGFIGGVATGVALLIAYLFGGYVAGRMARRSGLLHGLAVAVLSIVGGGLAGALITALADNNDIENNLQSIGVPTTWDEWSAVTVATALIALAGIVIGAVLGAIYGERWHTRLLDRAADPERGRSAEARRRLEELEGERDLLVQRDVRPVPERTEETERTAAREEEIEQLRRDQSNADDDIDLRDEARQPVSDDDEPRYTAAEWEAMTRSQPRGERF